MKRVTVDRVHRAAAEQAKRKIDVRTVFAGCYTESRTIMLGLGATDDEANKVRDWVTGAKDIGEVAQRMQALLMVFETVKPRPEERATNVPVTAPRDGHHRNRVMRQLQQDRAREALLRLAYEA